MNILHLTDLHFSIEDDSERVAAQWDEMITRARSYHEKYPLNAIAVTGDITNHGREEEYAQAGEYLLKLMQAFRMSRNQLWLCPGNHDADSEEAHSSFAHYENFVEKMNQVAPIISQQRQRSFPVYTINTCTETSLTFFDRAVILSKDAEAICAEKRKKGYGILLMHHQPEVIQNQEQLMQLVNSGKIRLLLCGHLHSTEPRIYTINNCVVVNGMAVTPHLFWLPSGMQIVHISTRGRVEVKPIYLTTPCFT